MSILRLEDLRDARLGLCGKVSGTCSSWRMTEPDGESWSHFPVSTAAEDLYSPTFICSSFTSFLLFPFFSFPQTQGAWRTGSFHSRLAADLDLGSLVPVLASRGSCDPRLGCCRASLRGVKGRNWAGGRGHGGGQEMLSLGDARSNSTVSWTTFHGGM